MMITLFSCLNLMVAFTPILLDETSHLDASDTDTARVYFIRHGESVLNVPNADGILMTCGNSVGAALTEKGIQQAEMVGSKLVTKLPKEAQYVVLSSTAKRASDTADRIFAAMQSAGYSVEKGAKCEEFCEMGQGEWEGKPKDKVYEAAMAFWENLSAADKFITSRATGGGNFREVAYRMFSGLQQSVMQYPDATIIIGSHFGAMNAIALYANAHMLDTAPGSKLPLIQLQNCDLMQVEVPNELSPVIIKAHISSGV